jgi:hypothetical protein
LGPRFGRCVHRLGFGFHFYGDFQQHHRQARIVAGAGQFARSFRAVPEMSGVQGNLLF